MSRPTAQAREFFIINSPLGADAPSYVERSADADLLKHLRAGKFAYVLTARQMGKTSLTNRIALRLQEEGIRTVTIDLTLIGDAPVEIWYQGFVTELNDQLGLEVDVEAWWHSRTLPPVHRFTMFLRDVVLQQCQTQIVVFIDEIDTTLKLKFSDDFFAAIRAVHNARDRVKSFQRISFVLLGVASPTDLIKDKNRTPFNIAERVMLYDFDLGELGKLQAGLEEVLPGQGERIFTRIYHWTRGHPYLTQKLCRLVWEAEKTTWSAEEIDELVRINFLPETALEDSNLRDVQDRIVNHARRRQLLELYRKILKGHHLVDDAHSIVQNQLKLLGLVKAEHKRLVVRNPIYKHVFNLAWVRTYTQINWARVVAVISTLVAAIAVGIIAYDFYWIETQKNAAYRQFDNATSPIEQVHHLARLFTLKGLLFSGSDDISAREKFLLLPPKKRSNLFVAPYGKSFDSNDLVKVVQKLYVNLADIDDSGSTTSLLQAIANALKPEHAMKPHLTYWQTMDNQLKQWGVVQDIDTIQRNLQHEIELWLEGRQLAKKKQYEAARLKFDGAVALNPNNPATLYERAKVYTKLGRYPEALRDLDQVVGITKLVPTPSPEPTELFVSRETETLVVTATPIVTQLTPTATKQEPTTSPTSSKQATIPTATTTPLPTNTPALIQTSDLPAFIDMPQRVRAVRDLINAYPSLAEELITFSSQYPNLVQFDLVPVPTPTLSPTSTKTPPLTATITPRPTEKSTMISKPTSTMLMIDPLGRLEDTIYTGELLINGLAEPGMIVQLQVNGATLGNTVTKTTVTKTTGTWALMVNLEQPGTYNIIAAMIDEGGAVLATAQRAVTIIDTKVTPPVEGSILTTPIKTLTATPTISQRPSATATLTAQPTLTPTNVVQPTVPPSPVSTLVPTPTSSPTISIVPWRSPTPTLTETLLPTATPRDITTFIPPTVTPTAIDTPIPPTVTPIMITQLPTPPQPRLIAPDNGRVYRTSNNSISFDWSTATAPEGVQKIYYEIVIQNINIDPDQSTFPQGERNLTGSSYRLTISKAFTQSRGLHRWRVRVTFVANEQRVSGQWSEWRTFRVDE